MTPIPLDELLPHRPPMVLIDSVESFDAEAKRLTARVTIGENQLFFTGDGVPNWVAIEYMAQTAAALVGCHDRYDGNPARPGLLLGTRRLELKLEKFEVGRTYRIIAENVFGDSDAASFACTIEDDDGKTVATASLNAYRPPDMEQFLKEQVKE
jgi:predicted hotdog family 3-hydroxylacyl-ACP dehydratase